MNQPFPTVHGPVTLLGAGHRSLGTIDSQLLLELLQVAMGILCQLGFADALADELVEAARKWEITAHTDDVEPDDWMAAQIAAWIHASCDAGTDVNLARAVQSAIRLGRNRIANTKLGRLIDRLDERD